MASQTLDETLDSGERALLTRLIVSGFMLRIAALGLVEWAGYALRFAPDAQTYNENGWAGALYWSGQAMVQPWWYTLNQPRGYFYVNTAFFYIFGHTDIPIRIANAFLGAFCCRYVYLISRTLFGAAVGRLAATLFEFFPSLVLWSILNIRDIWVVALIVFISWKSLQVVRGYSHLALFNVVGAALILATFRDYLFYVVAIPPVVAFLLGRIGGNLGRNFLIATIAATALVFSVQQGLVGTGAHKTMSLEVLSQYRQNLATGQSVVKGDVDISTPGKALAFLPTGVAYFLFSPFPWQITSLLKLFSLPEMLLIYYLAPAMFRGFRYTIRTRFRESLQVLLMTALLTATYALGEGNVGTLYRHRAQAMAFFLIFAAVGIETRRSASLGLA